MSSQSHSSFAPLTRSRILLIFTVLAFGYFLSALMRGVTATLAPVLSQELSLSAGQLGLLAGVYFFGFAGMQLPLGRSLDRYGPRRVLSVLLGLAIVSCLAFAWAHDFWTLLLARLLGGIAVSACLMAPLTGYRTWFAPQSQLRANSWMLMVGSFGLLSATLPVQWLLPLFGWRTVFVLLGILFAFAWLGLRAVPQWQVHVGHESRTFAEDYRFIWRHAYFWQLAPLAFINYGAVIAIQTLWAGPWMTHVAGYSAAQAASGLFAVNLTTLVVFWLWGLVTPRLARQGISADRLLIGGLPLSIGALALTAFMGAHAGWGMLAAYCGLATVISLSQPALGLSVAPHQAGRAMTAYNLLLFSGAFFWQWGMGMLIDVLHNYGLNEVNAYRAVFMWIAFVSACGYAWFARGYWKTHSH